jgi:hypothetical protein
VADERAGAPAVHDPDEQGVVMIRRRGFARAGIACLATLGFGLAAAPGWASTWTINGTIQNNTGASTPCGIGAPPGFVGCITAGAGTLDDGSLRNGNEQGAAPATFTPAAGGPTASTFQFFAPLPSKGADQYTPLTMPDGSRFVITAEDDVGSGGASGNYAGCAEANAQAPTSVCSVAWDGNLDNAQLTYTFGPSGQAASVAAGQRCSAELGGQSPASIDCAQAGMISPILPLSDIWDCVGGCGDYVELSDIGSNPVKIQAMPYAEGSENPQESICQLNHYADTCWVYAPVVDGTDSGEIVLSPPDPASQEWAGVEVVAVSNGASAGMTPNYVPNVDAVNAHVTSLRVSSAPRPGPRVRYRTDRWATVVFGIDRRLSNPHGSSRWMPVGHNTVQSQATNFGRLSAGRCMSTPSLTTGKPCRKTVTMRGLVADHTTGGRWRTVSIPVRLNPGRYRLNASTRAQGALRVGQTKRLTFTIADR